MGRKYQKGLSLLEVMVAFALLGVAIMPIISMYPAIFSISQTATETEEKTRMGMQIIEYIRAAGYTKITGTGGLLEIPASTNFNRRYSFTLLDANSKTFSSNDFADDFGYNITTVSNSGTSNENFFTVNVKQGFNANSASVYIEMIRTGVEYFNGAGWSPLYRNFISGVVVVGTGKNGSTLTGREKEIRLQFLLTPID